MKNVVLALVLCAFSAPAFANDHGHAGHAAPAKDEAAMNTEAAPAAKTVKKGKKKPMAKKEAAAPAADAPAHE